MARRSDVEPGQTLPSMRHTLTQGDLVRYAGASGDFNPLHWDAEVAAKVSPTGGIIAHGMLTMGHLGRLVADWAGAPERVRSLDAAFRAPWPVGATIEFGADVLETDVADGTATLAIWAELEGGEKVIDRRRSRAVVELD
jgi:acyl dehydratase